MAKKLTPEIRKAFAVASIVGAMLNAGGNGGVKLLALSRQVNASMQVFRKVAGRKEYYGISLVVQKIWEKMVETHNNTIDADELSLFAEIILNLVPKKDMKIFLGVHFTTNEKLRDHLKSSIMSSVLELDKQINEALGTKQTITREQIGLIIVKPVRIKAKRAKKPQKESLKQKKHEIEVTKHKERKVRVSAFLAGVRAKAEAKREELLIQT